MGLNQGTNDEILFPVVEKFGTEKAILIEKYSFLHARLVNKLKTVDNLDETLRLSVEVEIEEIRSDLDSTRRELGEDLMEELTRSTIMEDLAAYWLQKQVKIQERSAKTGGMKSGGLWSKSEY